MSRPASPVPHAGPLCDGTGLAFELGDRYRRLSGVALQQELGLGELPFTRVAGRWVLRIPRPPVDRMEYLFELEHRNGQRSTICDPGNPLRTPGAFGEKSVLHLDGYTAPAWMDAPAVTGTEVGLVVPARRLHADVTGGVWASDALPADEPAPTLVVHDGPEFAALGDLVQYVASSIHEGLLPPMRVALLDPGDRNAWYAANPDYAAALVDDVLAALPPASVRIGVGASLGALAMLHAHRAGGGVFDGLFLQSGSFFTGDLDAQESSFSGFPAITDFVGTVEAGTRRSDAAPVVMTCGVLEENLGNNRRMASTLTRLGHPCALHTVRDAHNFVAWRDALHPHLTDLVVRTLAAVRAT